MLCVFSYWSSLQDQTNLKLQVVFVSEDTLSCFRTSVFGWLLTQCGEDRSCEGTSVMDVLATFFVIRPIGNNVYHLVWGADKLAQVQWFIEILHVILWVGLNRIYYRVTLDQNSCIWSWTLICYIFMWMLIAFHVNSKPACHTWLGKFQLSSWNSMGAFDSCSWI